jgi:c-di-GMP-binding flagellar brake protein YcgR
MADTDQEAGADPFIGAQVPASPELNPQAMENRRKSFRKPFSVAGQMAWPPKPALEVRYVDISLGGVGLVSDLNIPPHSHIHLKFKIMLSNGTMHPFVVEGKVAHSTFSSVRRGFILGVSFIRPSDKLLDTIKNYMLD